MAKYLDQVLVVDVESTCWNGAPPAGESSDIIEIGLCVLHLSSLERLEKRSILVGHISWKQQGLVLILLMQGCELSTDFALVCTELNSES